MQAIANLPAMPLKYTDDGPTVCLATFLGIYVKYLTFQKTYKIFFSASRRALQGFNAPKGMNSWFMRLHDTSVLLTTCGAIFYFSGFIAVSFMHNLHEKRLKFLELYGDYKDERHRQFMRRNCLFLAICSIVYSLLSGGGAFFMYLTKYPLKTIAFSDLCLRSFEFYAVRFVPFFGQTFCLLRILFGSVSLVQTFLSSNSIMLLVASIVQGCLVVQEKIKEVDELVSGLTKIKCSSVSEAVAQVDMIQSSYQKMVSSRNMLEDLYSFPLFYIYSVSVPACCLLGYLSLRNLEGSIIFLLSVNVFLLAMIGSLIVVSYPAFKIHEAGERLLTKTINMYCSSLTNYRDSEGKMTFFVLQMHSNKLTLTANGFFPMEKRMLLALFSTITTNFLILVQFSEEK